jgi:hypothetical protein
MVGAAHLNLLGSQLDALHACGACLPFEADARDGLAVVFAPHGIEVAALVAALLAAVYTAICHFSDHSTPLALIASVVLLHCFCADHLPFRSCRLLPALCLSPLRFAIVPFQSFLVLLFPFVKNSGGFLLENALALTAPALKLIFLM